MEFEAIVNKLKGSWPEVADLRSVVGDPVCLIPAENVVEILSYMKDDADLSFDSLMSLCGVDTGQKFWVVYPLHSLKHGHRILVKAMLDRDKAEIDSVVSIWGMADFFEREAFDLFGIIFKGHPDLRRIINPPDWAGWPGRKDYEYPKDYQGIPTLREDQFFADKVDAQVKEREKKDKELAAKIQVEVKKELEEQAKQEAAS